MERAALERLRVLLHRIGSANDAQDHGSPEEAVTLRRDAAAGIGLLLREHAFLAEIYPGLGAAVGTPAMESSGWAVFVDDVERRLEFVDPARLPWDRVVHLGGRAGELSDWIVALGSDGHREAERRLAACLARDDRVTQATPLALRSILGALRFPLVRDPVAVGDLVARIGAAARAQVEAARARGAPTPRADWSLYRDDRLWPPFESAERDAELRAAWRPTEEEALGWAWLTLEAIREHEAFLARRPRR